MPFRQACLISGCAQSSEVLLKLILAMIFIFVFSFSMQTHQQTRWFCFPSEQQELTTKIFRLAWLHIYLLYFFLLTPWALKQGGIQGHPSHVWVGGTIFEVTSSFGQEQWDQRPQKHKRNKVWWMNGPTDKWTNGPRKRDVELRSSRLKIIIWSCHFSPLKKYWSKFFQKKLKNEEVSEGKKIKNCTNFLQTSMF